MRIHALHRSPLLAAAVAVALLGGLAVSAAPAAADETQPAAPLAEADPNPPTVVNTVPASDAVYQAGTQITVAFTCVDPEDPITFCAQYTYKAGDVVTLEPGSYHWRFYANNARTAVIHDVHFTVLPYDTTPPVLTVTAPVPQATGWYRGYPQVLFEATDGSGVVKSVVIEYADGSQSVAAGASQSKIFFDEGITTVQAFAIDGAGNASAPQAVTVQVDTVAPSVMVTAPAEGARFEVGQAVVLDYGCSDATSGIADCGGDLGDGAALDTSTPGDHAVELVATDVAGHETSTTLHYTVLPPDTEAPRLAFTAPAPGEHGWYAAPIEAVLSADDADGRGVGSIDWAVTGPDAGAGTASAEQRFVFEGDGVHVLTASAVDLVGNRGAEQAFTVRIDTSAPVVDTDTTLRVLQGTTADFTSLCSDAVSSVVRCEPIVLPALAATPAAPTDELGEHTAFVTAEDAAGNRWTEEVTYLVTAPPQPAAVIPAALALTGSPALPLGALGALALVLLGALALAGARLAR